MQISDEKLWESCLTGDKEAFKEIYCRFCCIIMAPNWFPIKIW